MHPQQHLKTLPDGGIRLEVLYSHPQEILMDILSHGAHVEVLQPTGPRSAVADAHRAAAAKYALRNGQWPRRGRWPRLEPCEPAEE